MTDTERLYDALDRLVHDVLSRPNTPEPDHRFSPVGNALHLLHGMRPHRTEHCICANEYGDPPL